MSVTAADDTFNTKLTVHMSRVSVYYTNTAVSTLATVTES